MNQSDRRETLPGWRLFSIRASHEGAMATARQSRSLAAKFRAHAARAKFVYDGNWGPEDGDVRLASTETLRPQFEVLAEQAAKSTGLVDGTSSRSEAVDIWHRFLKSQGLLSRSEQPIVILCEASAAACDDVAPDVRLLLDAAASANKARWPPVSNALRKRRGQIYRDFRADHNLTVDQCVDKLGMDASVLTAIVREDKGPKVDRRKRDAFLNFLNTTLAEWYGLTASRQ